MKKSPKWFYSHENSVCLQAFSAYHLIVPRCNDVGEMVDDQVSQQREDELKYLLDIIKCLRYLARREIPLQGLDNNDNLTQILYLLRTKVDNLTKHLPGQVGHKYTHHDIQNELLKFPTIRERKFFLIMADAGTNVSNIEQLSFCV